MRKSNLLTRISAAALTFAAAAAVMSLTASAAALPDYPQPDSSDGSNPYEQIVDGVSVYAVERGQWAGANINLGADESKWPWSVGYSDRKVAFEPEPDAEYRLTLNLTSSGVEGIYVRWLKDIRYIGYTEADSAALENENSIYSAEETAKAIPAAFMGLKSGEVYTLVTEFKMDGSQPAEGLVGNIGIRGHGGKSSFIIHWIAMERIDTGELMFLWDYYDLAPDFGQRGEPESAGSEPAAEPEPEPAVSEDTESAEAPADADNTPAAPVLGDNDGESGGINILLIISLGVLVIAVIIIIILIIKKKRERKWYGL